MFTDNPFLAVTDFLPPRFMQIYVVLMALAVIIGWQIEKLPVHHIVS